MITERTLRAASVALGVVALIDPACRQDRTQPIAVQVQPASAIAAHRELADRVQQRLGSTLDTGADVNGPRDPDAVVIAGEPADWSSIPDGKPVSLVTDVDPTDRNVRVLDIAAPTQMFAGVPTAISVTVAGREVVGESTRIALHLEGIEIDGVDHRWTRTQESFTARLEYLPPSAGTRQLRVSVSPARGEATESDNHADIAIDVADRKLRVLVHEPRPSWQGTFVRRAVEGDPLFEVSSLARTSRGIEVRAGQPPERLVAANLELFDAIVVGAPEELRESEVTALESYLRARGGAVIFVPDRRPSGPYAGMIPAATFGEVLVANAAALRGDAGVLRGSEFVAPEKLAPGVDVLAGLVRDNGTAPVVISWPTGLGRVIFSGALDAWRHRSRPDEFTTFWRSAILTAAAQSPAALAVAVTPTVVQPGSRVRVTARLRPTEFERGPRPGVLPEVGAVVQAEGKPEVPIRLWPTAEPGTFEGTFDVTAAGRLSVVATAGAKLTSRTELIAADGVRTATGHRSAATELLARASGGVVANASDLSAVESHLRALPQQTAATTIYPARSAWWIVAFVATLGAEWFLRRRRGAA
jgi:hypothetical protein